MSKAPVIRWTLVKRAVARKLPILGDTVLDSNLKALQFTRAECYRQGAEEAQEEIMRRLNAIRPAVS